MAFYAYFLYEFDISTIDDYEKVINTKETEGCFCDDLDSASELVLLFEYLPDVYFFVKDEAGKIMAGNRNFAQRMGFECGQDLVGKSTWEICPPELAELYVADDQQVMKNAGPGWNPGH